MWRERRGAGGGGGGGKARRDRCKRSEIKQRRLSKIKRNSDILNSFDLFHHKERFFIYFFNYKKKKVRRKKNEKKNVRTC